MQAKHVQLSASPLSGSMMTTKKDTKEHNIATTPKSMQEDCIYGMVRVQTSWTATLIALCQFFGSALTVRVVTVHPSLPESLWSNSIEVKGGFEL